jgi:hypothetical protein
MAPTALPDGFAESAARYEVRGHVAIVTLNRPQSLNAVNSALSTAVGEALEAAAADPDPTRPGGRRPAGQAQGPPAGGPAR